jgi:rhodanese-related sulfurtransferase
MRRFALASLAALGLFAAGPARAQETCSAGEPAVRQAAAPAALTTPPGVVDGATAHRLVAEGVKVVDVRTPAEFAAGHVPGAVNIPFDEIGKRHAELGPPSTPVLLYCRTGHRSGIAVRTLKEKGFTLLYDLQAFERWVAAGQG